MRNPKKKMNLHARKENILCMCFIAIIIRVIGLLKPWPH